MGDALLDDLDPAQRDAVTSTAAPLAILAPAGSGKTRVLTRRIAWRVRADDAEARHVLAVTFTRKAAAELRSRLEQLGVDTGVTAGTFHALALAQLRRRAAEQGGHPPTVLASKARLLAPLVGGPSRRDELAAVAAEIEWAQARGIRPEGFAAAAAAAGRRPPPGVAGVADVAEVYARYEREKRRRGVRDFDDLLSACADAIATDPDFAAAQRWRFRHLFVDEFQDATPLQVRLLRAWLGDRRDLCVVGDVAQSIYGFAGADAAPLAEFDRHFPGGTVVMLDRNHRSTPQVVAIAESVLGRDPDGNRTSVRATRADGPAATVTAYADDAAEARGVADALWRGFTDGVPWRGMAVLFRTNAQAAAFEEVCERRAVPYRRPGGDEPAGLPAARALWRWLAEGARGAPRPGFAALLADLAALDLIPDDAGGAPGTRGGIDPQPPVPVAGDDTSPADLVDAQRSLVRLGRDYLASEDGPGTLDGFRSFVESATRNDRAGSGVELLTFHRAKGLEWRVVFVTGLERGLVPIAGATTEAQRAEERRLLHVALGRATDELHLSWAGARTIGGRRREREPSPWLAGLEARARAQAVPPSDPREHVATIRAALASVTPPAPRRRDHRHR